MFLNEFTDFVAKNQPDAGKQLSYIRYTSPRIRCRMLSLFPQCFATRLDALKGW